MKIIVFQNLKLIVRQIFFDVSEEHASSMFMVPDYTLSCVRRYLSSYLHSDGPPSLLFNGYWRLLPQG
jgi:hypothetical protein